MTKYLGVSMIVLGTIILLVSYLSQSCDAIAGLFPISWVDINGIQMAGFFHLVLGGVIAHITSIKAATEDAKPNNKTAEIGLGLAAFSLIVSVVPLFLGSYYDQPGFVPPISIYGGMLSWLLGLYFSVKAYHVGKKQLSMAGLAVLALALIAYIVCAATVYAEA